MDQLTDNILLVLPVPGHNINGRIFFDAQGCNGLRLWLKYFQSVTIVCPTLAAGSPPPLTCPLDSVPGSERITYVALPLAYTPPRFFANIPKALRVLKDQISKADYLHFAIGGLWGDWAALASVIAIRSGLPFAVWTDRVQSKACAFESKTKTGLRRLSGLLKAQLMTHYEKYIVRRCSLGLFHGMDCFETYAPDCSNPHLVHDIHVGPDNLIAPSRLSDRLRHLGDRPLRFAYAGRVHQEKGIFDWIKALSEVAKAGITFDAKWFSPGGGPELAKARKLVQELDLTSQIKFPRTFDSHAHLLAELQTFDAFVFCHKISESPRCLIEALQCGLPIIGYETAYPKDLIKIHGGGVLTTANNVSQLSRSLISLSRDLNFLRALSERAAQDGALFTDETVFHHRSELMKQIKIDRLGRRRTDSRTAARVAG